MKLGMMVIFVTDLAEARRFYCDILGFPLKAEHENRLDFEHEGCDFMAFKCEKSATIEHYSQVARSVFVFEVAAIDKALDDLRAQGVQVLHEVPAENEFSRYAAFLDPFGNVHEICQLKR